jgi:putative transposase
MSTPVAPASLTAPAPSAPTAPAPPPDDPTIWRVDDTLWVQLEPLLRVERPRAKGGRPRHPDRPLLDGLLWLLRTGAQWAALPAAFGPKSTCHDRFQEWVASGAFARAWAVLLGRYDDLVGLDLTWQAADGCLTKAPLGKKGGPGNPWPPAATPPTGARPAPSATC